MPRGDGTGPAGMGPMTGRGAGYCAGYPVPGCTNPGGGRGMAWGRGGGRGMAWGRGGGRGMAWGRGGGMGMGWGRGRGARWGSQPRAYPPYAPAYAPPVRGAPSPDEELDMLRGQADWLKEQMDAISERIQELEGKKEE